MKCKKKSKKQRKTKQKSNQKKHALVLVCVQNISANQIRSKNMFKENKENQLSCPHLVSCKNRSNLIIVHSRRIFYFYAWPGGTVFCCKYLLDKLGHIIELPEVENGNH